MNNTTKSNFKYASGPYSYGWDRDGCNDYWYIFPASDQKNTLAQILFWDSVPDEMEQTEAQARLFAAAPEVLDTLKRLLNAVATLPANVLDVDFFEIERDAKLLIANTEGRA
ncbi:MAG TPA: hypothetical protein VGG19_06385 [Tepidisphaeraceae bacterium]|jgi:hypothetical protein